MQDVDERDFTQPGAVFQIGVAPVRIAILTELTALQFADAAASPHQFLTAEIETKCESPAEITLPKPRGKVGALPNTPIALRVPPTCEGCGREGLVRLQQSIRGGQVVLQWHCSGCDHEWPVRRKEEEAVKESA